MTGRRLLGVGSLFLMACASTTPARPSGDRVLATGPEGAVRDRQNAVTQDVIYPSPPALLLPVVRSVYEDLGIDVKLFDPRTGEVGNRNFSKSYRLAGVPLSKYVGCGSNAAGSAADNYRIKMNIVSRITSAGEGSRMETLLSATADDVGSSKGQLACETLGALETRINEAVAAKLKTAQ